MSPERELLFFVNPGAGAGGVRRRFDRLRRQRAGEMRGRVLPIESMDQVVTQLAECPPGSVPVAVGGDGTINLMVQALRKTGRHATTPLGILPLGTGNALAHSLRLGQPESAINALLRGAAAPVDAMITTHPAAPVALASISFGFEARVMTAAAQTTTWHRLLAGLAEAVRAAPAETWGVRVDLDGAPWLDPGQPFFTGGLYNLRCYALGRLVFPEARLDDGRAEAVVHASAADYLEALTRGRIMPPPEVPAAADSPAPGIPPGLRDSPSPSPRHWTSARVESPGSIQLDGESVPGGAFEVRLEPAAWQVLLPAPASGPHR